MIRTYGEKNIPLIECINPKYKRYRVRWDMQPYSDEEMGDGVSFMEAKFGHRPTIAEIKDIILSWMNEQIDERIISGFTWNGMQVWLSSENQFNYKAAYDIAVQTEGANLPIVFKFGTNEHPVYHEFSTVDELTDFYIKAMAHINAQLLAGCKEKDSYDWSDYENYLKQKI